MDFPYILIDLTRPLGPGVPCWEDGCGFRCETTTDYADAAPGELPFRVQRLRLAAGIGTHMDAPAHVIPGGKTAGDFTPQELLMPCRVVDLRTDAHERTVVSATDVIAHEAVHGPVPEGCCVMMLTGHGRHWPDPGRYRNGWVFPSISAEAAEMLLRRGASALGIDTLSPDLPDSGYPVHRLFLGAGKILLENIAQLEAMPPAGAQILTLPLKLTDGTEAPARVIGLIPRSLSR